MVRASLIFVHVAIKQHEMQNVEHLEKILYEV